MKDDSVEKLKVDQCVDLDDGSCLYTSCRRRGDVYTPYSIEDTGIQNGMSGALK